MHETAISTKGIYRPGWHTAGSSAKRMDCLLGEDLYRAVAEFQDGGEWPEGELSVQVAVDSLVELLKERIDQIIALSRKEDWRKRKEIADIGFSYFLLMKIHHWQISHRK